jgi:cobalt-precorrin-5B (C1)-methyltransferase
MTAVTEGSGSGHYILSGTKKLRCGYTTGTCAALAAKAAALAYFSGSYPDTVSLVTPKGWSISASVIPGEAPVSDCTRCGIVKDAGDDADVTDGLTIFASVQFCSSSPADESNLKISIDGGSGIGRVTRKGLDQPVGLAAINTIPRKMIEAAVCAVCNEYRFSGTVAIVLDVPGGEAVAAKTFNPHLGITGGLSILGSSGIVEPMSEQALVDSIKVEMHMISEELPDGDIRPLIITPGNYGTAFIAAYPLLASVPVIQCSNFIGDSLDCASVEKFSHVLLIGHAGKLVKLAGGIMNTHSKTADCRLELIAVHAACCGADTCLVQKILECATVDAAFSLLDTSLVSCASVVTRLLGAEQMHLERRTGGAYHIGIGMFTNERGLLGFSDPAQAVISQMQMWKNGLFLKHS